MSFPNTKKNESTATRLATERLSRVQNPLIEKCLKPNIVRTGINFAGSPVLFMNLRNLYVSLLLQQMCAEIQNKRLTSLLV